MGPLWDFNIAYGNMNKKEFNTPEKWCFEWTLTFISSWWEKFVADTIFTDAVKSRWAELRENVLNEHNIIALIDSNTTLVDESQIRNFERWPILGEYVWPNEFIGETYEEEITQLKYWISQRLDWIDKNIPDISITDTPDHKIDIDSNITRAYPNPFFSGITIRYQLHANVKVDLKIFNILGQEVRTLVNGRQFEGEYEIPWQGVDNHGKSLANGIYFYELRINGFQMAVNKLIKIGTSN
jgi:hypothetical protein